MSTHLVIRIGNAGDDDVTASLPAAWCMMTDEAVSDSELIVSSGSLSELDALREIPLHKVTLILPADRVTTLAVSMPNSRANMLSKALPYAVEEFLIEPIERCHIAQLGVEPSGSIAAAVISKTTMAEFCGFLDSCFPRTPSRILVDGWLIHGLKDNFAIAFEAGQVLIRHGRWQCFGGPESMLEPVITSLKAQYPDNEQFDRFKEHALDDAFNGDLCLDVVDLLTQAATYEGMDLRQGEFRAYNPREWMWPALTAVGALILSFCIIAAGNYYRTSMYNERSQEITQSTQESYQAIFPSQGNIVNMPVQARHHLNKLQQQIRADVQQSAFIPLVDAISTTIQQWGSFNRLEVESINYSDRERAVTLEVLVDDFPKMNDLQTSLAENELDAVILSASEYDDSFKGSIRVKHGND